MYLNRLVRDLILIIFSTCFFLNGYAGEDEVSILKEFSKGSGKIKIASEAAVFEIFSHLGRDIAVRNSRLEISVFKTSAKKAFSELGKGHVQIAAASDDPGKSSGLRGRAFAGDTVVVIVNKRNKISDLSREQVKFIFSGKINNWKHISGEDREIKVYRLGKKNPVSTDFKQFFLGSLKMAEKAVTFTSQNELQALLSADRFAIGYARGSAVKAVNVKKLKIDGIAPLKKNMLSGKYEFIKTYRVYTEKKPSKFTALFVDLLFSGMGRRFTEDCGLIPLPFENKKQE